MEVHASLLEAVILHSPKSAREPLGGFLSLMGDDERGADSHQVELPE